MSLASGSITWTHVRGRLHHQRTKETRQQDYTGFGQCRLCGAFLDSQLEHSETCSTAEATGRHYARVHAVLGRLRLADPGTTTEPRRLAEAQSGPADIFTTAAVPGRSAALDVCVASSTAAAARTRHKQPMIAKSHLTDIKFLTFRLWCGPQTVDHTSHTNPSIRSRHRSMPQWSTNVGKISSA